MNMKHKFVEFMPDNIMEGILYISPEYNTIIHLCACGCGEEINTPLSPTGWELNYNGKSISLSPSIGNWSYECRSHYWIVKNQVIWAEDWSNKQVNQKRQKDSIEREVYYGSKSKDHYPVKKEDELIHVEEQKDTLFFKILKLFRII